MKFIIKLVNIDHIILPQIIALLRIQLLISIHLNTNENPVALNSHAALLIRFLIKN